MASPPRRRRGSNRSLIAPAQLMREHDALKEWTVDQPAPSRAIH